MRGFVFLLAGLLVTSLIGGAQNPDDCASVKENGDEVTLRAESWNPVLTIGRTLADRYGINVSVEAPKWAFLGDTEDVAVADPAFSEQHGNIHYDVMKRHAIEVRFSIVPTRTRNSNGHLEDALPLLDRNVTIPLGTRSIAEHANLMADELSKQTGLHIGCCQALVAGVPWGMAKVRFEADNKPAREVLKWLILTEQQANSQASSRHPNYDHWVVRCDGTGAPWCFIEVEGKFSSRCP